MQLNTPKHSNNRVYSPDGISPTLNTMSGGKRSKDGVVPTITCGASWENNNYLLEDVRIRKLTPTECFRLQGFLNDEIDLSNLSNTQQYKLAGNGQSLNVVKKILSNILNVENLY